MTIQELAQSISKSRLSRILNVPRTTLRRYLNPEHKGIKYREKFILIQKELKRFKKVNTAVDRLQRFSGRIYTKFGRTYYEVKHSYPIDFKQLKREILRDIRGKFIYFFVKFKGIFYDSIEDKVEYKEKIISTKTYQIENLNYVIKDLMELLKIVKRQSLAEKYFETESVYEIEITDVFEVQLKFGD